ncbi:MAG: PKD domain-containing protein [Thermoplasmatota archaeon]
MVKKYLTILLVFTLVLSSLLIIPAPDHEENLNEDYFLVRDHSSPVLERSKELDFTVIEEYDNFALIKGKSDNILRIEHEDIVELKDHSILFVKGRTVDISSKESVRVSEKSMFLIRMHGPIKNKWRRELETMGVNILNYVPNYAFHVQMDSDLLKKINDLRYVSWVGEYEPEYKIDRNLEPGMVRVDMFNSESDLFNINELTDIKGIRGSRNKVFTEIRSYQDLQKIANMDDVIYIQNIDEMKLNNEMESQLLGGFWDPDEPSAVYRDTGDFGANINHLGYTGQGITIAVADTGIGDGTVGDAGHVDFNGRVVGGTDFGAIGGWNENWGDGHGHGTHTAGLAAGDTYGGTGQQYEGHAPYYLSQSLGYDSELYAQKVFDNEGSWSVPLTVSYYDIVEDAKQNGDVYVHSNSWGEDNGDGVYRSSDSDYDKAVRDSDSLSTGNQPMAIVASAGNDGSNMNSISSPGNGKNVITVGSTESYMPDAHIYGSSGYSDDPYSITSFSSRGWTEDNRVKPTVVAPGRVSLSTSTPLVDDSNLWGLYSEDDRYEWGSGTSQSTPNVASAAAVVSQYYEETHGHIPSPAMVKAILINSAIDLETDHSGDGEIDHIPNRYEGWGLVDLTNIIGSNISYISQDQTSLLETGKVDEYSVYPDNMNEPLKITLTWTDRYADEGDTPTIKNDLNLEVVSPSGKRYKGNAFSDGWTQADTDTIEDFDDNGDGFDNRNVVENVYIHPNDLEEGFYEIRIEGYDIPEDANNDGTANQDYSLLAHNSREVESDGSVHFDQDKYAVGDTVNIMVMDSDLIGNGSIEVEVESNTDPNGEIVELYESDIEGVFTGSIDISEESGDGILQVSHNDVIEGVYHDENIGDGTSETKTVTSDIDGMPPEISDVEVKEKLAAELTLETDEPASISVKYGIDDELNRQVETENFSEEHSMVLDNLSPNRTYSFKINATDEVGNWMEYDSEDHRFRSSNIDDVEEGNIGWEPDEGWEVVDTISYSGDFSWNFGQGNYDTRLDESLISPKIDTSRWGDMTLSWYHRYDFEEGYDGGIVEADLGSGWEKLVPEDGYYGELETGYNNPIEGEQAFTGNQDLWRKEIINISEGRDSIRFRFRVGTDTHDTDHEGWWIDDIRIVGTGKPTANFTYEPENPTRLDDINFYDSSYNLDGDVNYTWDFGDGNNSYEKDPVKRYDEMGVYDVTLTVKDESGIESQTSKNIEIINIPPRPNFTFQPERPTARDDIEFIDQSYDPDGEVVEHHWDFDDGNFSDEKDAIHSYSSSGTYKVTLVVWDEEGEENYTTKEIEIENIPPSISFDYTPDEIYPGDEVNFQDNSVDYDGGIVDRTWDFGDGETSQASDPTHTYEEPGEYRVTLTGEDNMGATNSTHRYLTVESPDPTADFTYQPDNPQVDEEIQFLDNSTKGRGDIVSREWDFGDGTVSEEQNPTHLFQDEGEYIVSLTVTDEEGESDTIKKTVVVEKGVSHLLIILIIVALVVIISIISVWYYKKYQNTESGLE